MNVFAKMNLKTRAVFATGGILLLVLTFNTARQHLHDHEQVPGGAYRAHRRAWPTISGRTS